MSDTVDKPQAITELGILRSCFFFIVCFFLFSVENRGKRLVQDKKREKGSREKRARFPFVNVGLPGLDRSPFIHNSPSCRIGSKPPAHGGRSTPRNLLSFFYTRLLSHKTESSTRPNGEGVCQCVNVKRDERAQTRGHDGTVSSS